jgi:predicted CoA-binding protein
MATSTLDAKVEEFLAQKRIAVAGVSRDKGHRLKTTGHDVFAVNPNMETFEGNRCYPNLQSIPGGVDGVVVITRPQATEQIVRDCVQAHVPRVWMHQSVASGTSVSQAAVDYCREHDVSVIAGACPMMYGPGADVPHRCMRWVMKVTRRLPS